MPELSLTSPVRYWISLVSGWLVAVSFAITSVAVAVARPLEPDAQVAVVVAAASGAILMARATMRLREIRVTAEGLRISGPRGRVEEVPWTRVRRMQRLNGRGGARWIVDYDAEGGVRMNVRTLHGDGHDWNHPSQVEQVHALWSAAVGPVHVRRTVLDISILTPGRG